MIQDPCTGLMPQGSILILNSLLSDENRPKPVVFKGLYEFAGVCGSEYWTYKGDTLVCIEPVGPPPLVAIAGGSDERP